MASNDIWDINPSDREFLTRQGATEREAILAAGLVDGVPPWRIGEVAGYGAGRSSDPEKHRQNWSAAVSRAAKRGGQVVPRVRALIDALKHFRQHGEGPKVADEREILEKLSTVIRSSSDSQVISAARTLLESYRRDRVPKQLSAEEIVWVIVARVGREKARIGIEALTPNLLCFVSKVDPAEPQADELRALNGVSADLDERNGVDVSDRPHGDAEINARLSTLEQRQL